MAITSTPVSRRIASADSPSLSSRLAAIASRTPSPAKARAVANPRRSLAPVTRATFPRIPRSTLSILQDRLGDGVELHERGPLVDLPDLGVPVELLHGVLARVPVAAEDLDRGRGDPLGRLAGVELGHGGLL